MDIQILAFILLVGRLVSEYFIIQVLRRQWKIRNTPVHPRLRKIRGVLSLLAILVFIGNIYPLLLDAYTLFHPGVRSIGTINLVGTFYSLDNSITFMIASILIWTLYKLSDVVIEVAELYSGQSKSTIPPKK